MKRVFVLAVGLMMGVLVVVQSAAVAKAGGKADDTAHSRAMAGAGARDVKSYASIS